MSVDSFVHFGRDNDPTGAPHPNRGNTGSTFDLHNNHTPAYNYFLHGRNHRSSIESTGEVDGSVDSDVERSDPMERYRHPSLKDSSRPHIRGGELPLPSRTPASSSTSSMSSMASTSASSSSTLEDVPRQQPLPSLQSFTGRPISSATPNRTRSGSLGTYMNTGRQRPYETRQPASGAPYTLALALRSRDLRRRSLDPRQDWQVRSGESSFPLHVIEIDVPPGQLAPAETTHPPDWLDTISEINGVIICYDANDQSSFSPVEGLLRRVFLAIFYHVKTNNCSGVYQAAKVPYIVLACKSDLQHEVEPREASEMIQQYDAGLVEGAKSHSEGRKGLRNVFSWILMAIERDRRHKGLSQLWRFEDRRVDSAYRQYVSEFCISQYPQAFTLEDCDTDSFII
ncbi:hypothetical protein DXG01_000197 [Tephrocybe rancida]|nr:hypothetical protein DXG01_000197 [Tephrocybe rancida]